MIGKDSGFAWAPWAAAAGVAVFAACWLVMSEQFFHFDSDMIVPKLASTLHWTPYFWHTSRNGQLLPLLAMPFADPLCNLVAQVFLGVFSGVLAIELLVAYALRGRGWFVPGTFAVACFLFGFNWAGHHHFLEGSQTYGTGTCLVIAGLLIVRRTSWRPPDVRAIAVAFLLVALGLWVNLIVFVLGLLLVAADAVRLPLRRLSLRRTAIRGGMAVAVLLVALVVNLVATGMLPAESVGIRVPFGFVPLGRYPSALSDVAGKAVGWMHPGRGPMLVAAAVIAGAWLEGAKAWPRGATVLAVAGFGFIAVVGGMKWVVMNNGSPRYIVPGMVSLAACAAVLPLTTLRRIVSAAVPNRFGQLPGGIAAATAVSAALLFSFGPPDPGAARRAVARVGSPLAEQVVASGADFVAGDYWIVWPVVFKANLILHQQGESRRVWGLTGRANVTRDRWDMARRGGTATLAHVAKRRGSDDELVGITNALGIQLGEPVGGSGGLELHRFRLEEQRIASRP